METIKKFLAKKSAGWYVAAAAFILAVITLIIYTVRGGNSYSPVSGAAVALLVVGIITNAAVLVCDFKVGAFLPYVFYCCALGVLFNTEMLFITNVLTGVDGNSFDAAYITFFVFLFLTLASGFAAAVMKLTKRASA